MVDAVCVSEEVGARKPDPRIFDEAARRCDTELAGWMIGDSPTVDVAGGRAAGLRTAWLHRGREWDPAVGATPDLVVDSVTTAVQALLSDA